MWILKSLNNDVILSSVDVKKDVELRFHQSFTVVNNSDIDSDVAESTDTEQNISYVESEAFLEVLIYPWFNVVDSDAFELSEPDFRVVLDQFTFLLVFLIWTFSLSFWKQMKMISMTFWWRKQICMHNNKLPWKADPLAS